MGQISSLRHDLITRVGKGRGIVGASPARENEERLADDGQHHTEMVGVALFRGETSEPRTGQAPGSAALGILGMCALRCLRCRASVLGVLKWLFPPGKSLVPTANPLKAQGLPPAVCKI